MPTRQNVEQVKAYYSGVENPHNSLHEPIKGSRVGQGKPCMSHFGALTTPAVKGQVKVKVSHFQAEKSALQVRLLTELKQTKKCEEYIKFWQAGKALLE